MPVTLKDIANRVGRSITTVSRALGDYDDVSPATRREVRRVAREMGYEPNIAARILQKQRTDTIALILPTTSNLRFSDPFFSEFLTGLVRKATRLGYTLNLTSDSGVDVRETYRRHIRSRRVDGYVIMRLEREDERIAVMQELDVPFVAFGRVGQDDDFHQVDVDDVQGIRQAVDHLVTLGHRHLACISEPTRFAKGYRRLQSFRQSLEAHGLPVNLDLIVETEYRQRSGRRAAQQLLELPVPPTAIVACNDLLALGAVSAAQERGLVVGQDISITGFDDIMLASYASPPLTTVHLPAQMLGRLAAQTLIELIRGQPVAKKQVIVRPRLIVRGSTGPRQGQPEDVSPIM